MCTGNCSSLDQKTVFVARETGMGVCGVCVCTHAGKHVCGACVWISLYVYVHMCMCMYACVCV